MDIILTEELISMNLHTQSGSILATGAQTLIIFAYSNEKKVACDVTKGTPLNQIRELVFRAAGEGRFKGGNKETVFFRSQGEDGFENVLVVGLGDRKKINE